VILSSSINTGNLWSTGSTNQSIEVQTSSIIVLTVTDTNGCSYSDTVNVINNQVSCFSYPTIFTPNGDGYNDTWEIQGVEFYPSIIVQIFNRWGQKVFSSEGYASPWNGTYNNDPLPTGDYFFIIDLGDGNPINGALTLKN
jgi:gliding motility-associated-like protein